MKKSILAAAAFSILICQTAEANVWMPTKPTDGRLERMNALPDPAPKRFARMADIGAGADLKNESRDPKTETLQAPQVPQAEAVPSWRAASGRSLHAILSEWSRKAGWTLAWNTDQDYILRAGVEFQGDFVGSATLLIKAFRNAYPPVYGQFHKGNNVLVITTPKDVDQR